MEFQREEIVRNAAAALHTAISVGRQLHMGEGIVDEMFAAGAYLQNTAHTPTGSARALLPMGKAVSVTRSKNSPDYGTS